MYRIPYENEQITKTIAAPYAPVDFTEEEKAQFRDNIGAGGGGGSSVTVTPIVTTGTNIADITVDGTTSHLYAPSGGGGGGGRNLLDNGWFGSGVVNQRGFTSLTASAETYIVDRWYTRNRGTYTLTDSGLTLTPDPSYGAIIRQKFEYFDFGKEYTLSFKLADETIHAITFTPQSGALAEVFFDGMGVYGGIDARGAIPYAYIAVEGTETAKTIKAVKLELGSVSTLANDSAPDYATELLKCQRYFISLTQGNAGAVYLGAGGVFSNYGHLFIPCHMRTKPTLTVVGSISDFVLNNGSGHVPTGVNVDGHNIGNGVELAFPVSGISNGQYVAFYLNTGKTSDIWLSADL